MIRDYDLLINELKIGTKEPQAHGTKNWLN